MGDCSIETPEGPNIGLISSLAMYAEVNSHGFIESPYRKVKKNGAGSIVSNDTEYLSADDEDRVLVAQALTQVDNKGVISEDLFAQLGAFLLLALQRLIMLKFLLIKFSA